MPRFIRRKWDTGTASARFTSRSTTDRRTPTRSISSLKICTASYCA